MIKYNHYKVHAITFLLSVFPALIYMYFYVNGYFGDRLVNWWLLKDIVDSIFHPINILGWVVVVFVLLRLLGKKFYIVQHSKAEIVKTIWRISDCLQLLWWFFICTTKPFRLMLVSSTVSL